MLWGRIAAQLYKPALQTGHPPAWHAGPAGSTGSHSERRVARRARVGNHIANIAQPRHVAEQALKAQPETGMRHGAIAAQVHVPAIGGFVQPVLGHALAQHIKPLLALRAAKDRKSVV